VQAARGRNSRRACDVRSHPSTVDDSTEVQRSSYDRIFEREICNTDFLRPSESEEKFHRKTILGKRVLCQYSWIGGEADSGLYTESVASREVES